MFICIRVHCTHIRVVLYTHITIVITRKCFKSCQAIKEVNIDIFSVRAKLIMTLLQLIGKSTFIENWTLLQLPQHSDVTKKKLCRYKFSIPIIYFLCSKENWRAEKYVLYPIQENVATVMNSGALLRYYSIFVWCEWVVSK